MPSSKQSDQATFCEFLCYFHICKKRLKEELSVDRVAQLLNVDLRFTAKQRCIVSMTISNKHLHLLQEITLTRTDNTISRAVNRCLDMHIEDATKQAPLLCALRQ